MTNCKIQFRGYLYGSNFSDSRNVAIFGIRYSSYTTNPEYCPYFQLAGMSSNIEASGLQTPSRGTRSTTTKSLARNQHLADCRFSYYLNVSIFTFPHLPALGFGEKGKHFSSAEPSPSECLCRSFFLYAPFTGMWRPGCNFSALQQN